jgi:hypothetical protein
LFEESITFNCVFDIETLQDLDRDFAAASVIPPLSPGVSPSDTMFASAVSTNPSALAQTSDIAHTRGVVVADMEDRAPALAFALPDELELDPGHDVQMGDAVFGQQPTPQPQIEVRISPEIAAGRLCACGNSIPFSHDGPMCPQCTAIANGLPPVDPNRVCAVAGCGRFVASMVPSHTTCKSCFLTLPAQSPSAQARNSTTHTSLSIAPTSASSSPSASGASASFAALSTAPLEFERLFRETMVSISPNNKPVLKDQLNRQAHQPNLCRMSQVPSLIFILSRSFSLSLFLSLSVSFSLFLVTCPFSIDLLDVN